MERLSDSPKVTWRAKASLQDSLSPAHCAFHSTLWLKEGEDDGLVCSSIKRRKTHFPYVLQINKDPGWKTRLIAKAFLESGIRKPGGKLFPANGDHIRKPWGKGFFLRGKSLS